jgi:hypothetical protein
MELHSGTAFCDSGFPLSKAAPKFKITFMEK